MFEISFSIAVILITCIWAAVRLFFWLRKQTVSLKREAALILVYICLVVVVRFTFFPFSRVNGQVQPLLFDPARMFPPRINLIPLAYLFDYLILREALINVIGNIAMFLPIGIIWPAVFCQLNSPVRAICSGICFSLCIEILQLPFYDRVSDIDDLLLNSLGFILGYGIYRIFLKRK